MFPSTEWDLGSYNLIYFVYSRFSVTACSDVLTDCADYGKSACTGDYENWAKQNCKLYCNYCDGWYLFCAVVALAFFNIDVGKDITLALPEEIQDLCT